MAVKAVVITGGAAPPHHAVRAHLKNCDLVIAADSGLQTARGYKASVDVVVGDFDSIRDEAILTQYQASDVRRYPTAKDETDTEIALDAAREAGADDIVLVGGGGGRLDHLLALVALFERTSHPAVWITDTAVVRAVDDEFSARGRVGERISFFPLGCDECRMESEGLKWPLDAVVWRRGEIGVSNEFSQTHVRVRMISGRLLAIREIGGE